MRFSEIEIKEIIKSWFIISLAFAILLTDDLLGTLFFRSFLISSLTVGLGFLLHELAHKLVAQKYGLHAEYKSFNTMLVLALIMSFFGFIFAAPGAVMIKGFLDRRKNGIISAAGPLMNFILGFIFLIFLIIGNFKGFFLDLLEQGFFINVVLGLFNLIPIWNIDGSKILSWNKFAYGSLITLGLLLFFIESFI